MTIVADVLRAPFMVEYQRAAGAALQPKVVLELCYLAATSDFNIGEEEVGSLRELAAHFGVSDFDSLLREFNVAIDGSTYGDRVLAVARQLTDPAARRFAFSLVIGMNVADLNASPDEEDLEAYLTEEWAFGEEAIDLKGAVMRLFLKTDD